ncbi:short-chain dehydrogenase [Gymnopus androsaceus JB14]|uniref:Short-chain dehydrogenase n=1 Tax=Gymnopus androsaceus JB14 TaxID=1447944 RepID=A0A6A4IAW9_9AGAR|nr:short-chain dehydrogenase [Gymnopus androsaceus JB14]
MAIRDGSSYMNGIFPKFELPPVVKGDLTGKTVMITGANSGIGFEAAKHFATMNPARLIIVCRSVEKAQESIKQIEGETGYKNAEPMALDLGKFSSISEFATRASKTLDRLDILVENAAVALTEYVPSEDGWESMLQVNAVGPAMHVLLLLPIIINTAKQHSVVPRIVVVSSGLAYTCDIGSDAIATPNTLETLSSKKYCTAEVLAKRYQQTKILNVMLVRKLVELLPKTVVPVTLSPGFCLSGLRRNATGEIAVQFKKMEETFAYTSEEGSRHIIFSAIGGTDEELRGAFISESWIPLELPDWMLSQEGKKAEDKIWTEMLTLFGKLDDRIPGIVTEYLKV